MMLSKEEPTSGNITKESGAYKLVQAIYHVVTGKTETISKQFTENYKIEFEDIVQLHTKCVQMCTQWDVISQNENITFYHADNSKERFTSIERLELYNRSHTSPIETVTYEYNVLVKSPNVDKPQPYKVNVKITSGIALAPETVPKAIGIAIIRFFSGAAISLNVEYVDYVIARNIISTLDSWVQEIEITKSNKILKLLQQFSHWIPRFSGILILCLATLSGILSAETILGEQAAPSLLAKFLISTFGFITLSYFLGILLGRMLERSIDRMQEMSYIEINKGDAKLLSAFRKNNRHSIMKASIALTLLTIHAIGCSYIGAIIFELLK